jgi:dihydrofolate reductase
MLSIIVAVAENGVIGGGNQLLWKLSSDLKRFKELTTGHPIIMGRKTFESIGRALPNRRNIVVTRQGGYAKEGIETAPSLEDAIMRVAGEPEFFVIGGGELYRQALPHANRIYLTRVHKPFEGDTTFPELGPEWREASREEGTVDEKNPLPHTFLVYEK